MNGVVQVDAGQDRKHIGLQERDQNLESVQRDRERQRQHAADPAERAEREAEHGDEAREHLQRDVAGQHVGEQTDAVGDRSQEERQDLDEHDQRQDVDGDAVGNENLEELQAVLDDAVNQDGEEDQKRQGGRYDQMARDREGIGDDADQVRDAQKHEQREDQREEFHALRASVAADCGGDELV